MQGVGFFERVSEKAYVKQFMQRGGTLKQAEDAYSTIKLPRRATAGSAGYDFAIPLDISLNPSESIEVLTGIRAKINEGWVMLFFPRSGLGFKYHARLANTVGVIDSDYYYSDNEGHIIIKLYNGTTCNEILSLSKGERFAQGVFVPFGTVRGDDANGVRNGGLGSTERV